MSATSFWWKSISDGLSGWGEVTAGENPFYNEEWTDSAWLIVRNFAAPRVLKHTFEDASQVADRTAHIRGHRMARGGVEAAVWDLEARRYGVPLAEHISGGARAEIPCGVSIGIQDSVAQLLKKIETEVNAGYQRIKMKIKPGWDVDVIREVRDAFPKIRLMADANSAYTLADAPRLKCLDEFDLMMIEQPLAHDEIIDHVELQAQLQDPDLPGRMHPLRASCRAGHPHEGVPNHQHQARPRGWIPRSQTRTRRRADNMAFRCGAAECSNRASAARTISRFRRCRISSCQAMFRRASDTGRATSSRRRWRYPSGERLRSNDARLRLRNRSRFPEERHGAEERSLDSCLDALHYCRASAGQARQ